MSVAERGKPEPPKVDIRQKCVNFLCLHPCPMVDELTEFVESLRPYFPRASQTENTLFQKVITFLESCRDKAKAECGIYLTANHFETILESLKLAIPASTARTDQQLYVISVTGDGGQTTIVPESLLKSELHKAYCSCGKDWQKCSDEVVTNTIAKLDDAEEWTQNYPSYERHIWLDHGEDYTVQVMRVSAPGSVPQAPKDECLYGPVGKHIFNPHDDEPRRCVNCGVPQAEPPKEEKQK